METSLMVEIFLNHGLHVYTMN